MSSVGSALQATPAPSAACAGARVLHLQSRKHERIDAKSGIDVLQLLAHERRQMLGRAARQAQAGAHLGHRAVGAVERQHDAARTEVARCQRRAQLLTQPTRLGFELRRRDERLGERALHE